MRIDWDTPISELMHSESDQVDTIHYIDLDEDEMMHWKYIKREKLPNGKYRYYYHDDAYAEAKNDYERKKQEADAAEQDRMSILSKNAEVIDQINKEHNAQYGDKAGDDSNWSKYIDKVRPYVEENNMAVYKANQAAKQAANAEVTYKRAKAVYDKSAGHKVADLLNNASEKINKAIRWASNLFKKNK